MLKSQLLDCLKVVYDYTPSFQKKEHEKLWTVWKNTEKAYKQGVGSIQFWVTWALIHSIIKILKEDKDDINHDETMDNSSNECKLNGQSLKIDKRGKKEDFSCSGKIKS